VPLRSCTVHIPSERGGHYEHRIEAESSLQAASIALAEHEELARTGKLKARNRITPATIIDVYLEGDSNGVSFNPNDSQHRHFRHSVGQVRKLKSTGANYR
jgi:hypothetical protein